MLGQDRQIYRKGEIVGILEQICQDLELTETQHATAKARYEAVGGWLAGSENALLGGATIYPQGSVALGTTVKPVLRNEHDVDLVCFVPGLGIWLSPATLKSMIGERLRQNGRYEPILEEMPRCWRLNFANEFHADITPSIINPGCAAGGELVPDKQLMQWKPSHPKGYVKWFEERAALQPRMRFAKSATEARADVEAFPTRTRLKGILRRIVQLGKRHRDVRFADVEPSLRPISIIITTLAAKSYAHCVSSSEYENELDLVQDVVRLMPSFIEHRLVKQRRQWFIWNETTAGENFAEKWNAEPERAESFFRWHAQAFQDLDEIVMVEGLDRLTKSLSRSFGDAPVSKAMRAMSERVSEARQRGHLLVAPGVGLSVNAGVGSKVVRTNTFFGAE